MGGEGQCLENVSALPPPDQQCLQLERPGNSQQERHVLLTEPKWKEHTKEGFVCAAQSSIKSPLCSVTLPDGSWCTAASIQSLPAEPPRVMQETTGGISLPWDPHFRPLSPAKPTPICASLSPVPLWKVWTSPPQPFLYPVSTKSVVRLCIERREMNGVI